MSRLHYLDYIKGFAILLVVLGHVHTVEPLFMWYESFYMPIFFAVSGILIAYKEQKNGALTFSLKKTARGILLPYFTFSLLYMALIFLIDALGGTLTGDIVWQYVVDLFVFKGVSVNWFLLMLFFGECLFYLLRRFLRRDWLFVAVTLVLLVGAYFVWQMPAPWKYACRIFVAQSFIVFGYYFYKLVLNNTAKWAAVCRSWGFVIALMAVQVVTSQLLRDNIHGIYLTNGVLGSAAYILFFYKLNHVNIPPLRFFGQEFVDCYGHTYAVCRGAQAVRSCAVARFDWYIAVCGCVLLCDYHRTGAADHLDFQSLAVVGNREKPLAKSGKRAYNVENRKA